MKYFDWNDEKNEILKKTRGLSFELVELAIASGDLIARLKHPNPRKYPKPESFSGEDRRLYLHSTVH